MHGDDTDTHECSVGLGQPATVAPSPTEAAYDHAAYPQSWANVENSCADRAAALEAFGLISYLVGSTLPFILQPCSVLVVTLTKFLYVLRSVRDAHACPTGSVQKLVKCL